MPVKYKCVLHHRDGYTSKFQKGEQEGGEAMQTTPFDDN